MTAHRSEEITVIPWYWLVVSTVAGIYFGASIMALAVMSGRDNASW